MYGYVYMHTHTLKIYHVYYHEKCICKLTQDQMSQ